MKIAQVVVTFPPDLGGMGQVVYDEAAELTKRGHDVTVFCLGYSTSRYNDNTMPFKVVRLIPHLASGNAGFVPGLYKKLNGFDLTHLHYPFYGGAEWVWWRRIWAKQKYIVTYHMDAAPARVHRWFIQKLYDWTIAKFILRSAEQVLFVDDEQSQKLALRKKLSPNKIAILPNGIDVEIFKPQPVTIKDFTLDELEGKPIFLFVGNLLPVKGLEVLLKAWAKLNNKEAVLLIVGGGYEEDHYRKLAGQMELGNRVRWLGSCSDRKKLAQYYSLAMATIVPSFSESFSLVTAEAAACGSPVIGSDIHGMRARVIPNKTGILFQSKNVTSLTQAIEQIMAMTEAERKQWGTQGRELIVNNFSLQKHVDELEKVYKHLL